MRKAGLETDDTGFLFGRLGLSGIKLADDAFDAGDFLLGAADHDAVVFRLGNQRGRAACRFELALDLFLIKLSDERRQFRGGAAKQLDAFELARGGGGGG
ncbi:MAG: hypothetical protein NTY01_23115, partial [Verrucomicrobia bacterium]|nr:hypothetical protein [Verrucomicrobiota bacterium]